MIQQALRFQYRNRAGWRYAGGSYLARAKIYGCTIHSNVQNDYGRDAIDANKISIQDMDGRGFFFLHYGFSD